MSKFFAEYTRQVTNGLWIKPTTVPLTHNALGLMAEAGEVADVIKKSQYLGGDLDQGKMIEELGDTFWYFTQIIDYLGATHEDIARANIAKLEDRHGHKHFSPYGVKLLELVSA